MIKTHLNIVSWLFADLNVLENRCTIVSHCCVVTIYIYDQAVFSGFNHLFCAFEHLHFHETKLFTDHHIYLGFYLALCFLITWNT